MIIDYWLRRVTGIRKIMQKHITALAWGWPIAFSKLRLGKQINFAFTIHEFVTTIALRMFFHGFIVNSVLYDEASSEDIQPCVWTIEVRFSR